MPYFEPPPPGSVVPGTYTLVQAMALDPTQYPRKYIWCTDLFGGSPDWLISDGTQWKPVRPAGLQTLTAAGAGTSTFTALVNAPTQVIDGVLGGLATNLSIAFSTQYAWKGAKFRVTRKATGLGGLLVNGLGLSLNSWADQEFNGTTWVQTASGGLL